MKRALVVVALVAAGAAVAADTPPADPKANLQRIVGTWTIDGRESSYRETCDWYHGGHHIVCHTESKGEDGSINHSMSILAHAPGQGYVYTGIGAEGRYETFRNGTFENGILEYRDRMGEDAMRIRVGPYGESDAVPFLVEVSRDGKSWNTVVSHTYRRVK